MNEIQTEIVDNTSLEQFEGNLTGVTPVSITSASGKTIRYFILQVPDIGPNSNSINRYLRYSVNGGTSYSTMKRGEAVGIEGLLPSNTLIIKGDGGVGSVNYELIFGLDKQE